MTKPQQKQSNEGISATAWIIAHQRSFTDIPYSKQIFEILEKQRSAQGSVEITEEFKSPQVAPQTEARYKLVDHLLRENKVEQVLEIASGFSPRGLQMTNNQCFVYVEVDLPNAINQKRRIVSSIGLRANLHLEVANALDLETLRAATRHFDPSRKLGIVHEGLLRYLNLDKKAKVSTNIHSLLEEFNGVWITPDITLKAVVQAENAVTQGSTQRIGKLIGVDIDQNRFEDVDHAQKFFEDLGFSIERHRFMEVIDELSSPKVLKQTREQVEKLIGNAYVFVMLAV